MKTLTFVLAGLAIILLSFVPGRVYSQQTSSDPNKVTTPELNCPPGKFDSMFGVCKAEPKAQIPDTTKAATPELNCPPGKWDSMFGRCTAGVKEKINDTTKAMTPELNCPPGKWDSMFGRCNAPSKAE